MSLDLLAEAARRAADELQRLAKSPGSRGGGGSTSDRDLADRIRRGQMPELLDELKKAIG